MSPDELLGLLAEEVVEVHLEAARGRWPAPLAAMSPEKRRALVRASLPDQTLPRAIARAVVLAYLRHKKATDPDDTDAHVTRAWGSH